MSILFGLFVFGYFEASRSIGFTGSTITACTKPNEHGLGAKPKIRPSPGPLKKRKVELSGLIMTGENTVDARLPPRSYTHRGPMHRGRPLQHLGVDILLGWRDVGQIGYPNVARMVRQFLGCPATPAGVERLFSKAGRAYNFLPQSQQEDTLEARMFTAISINRVGMLDMCWILMILIRILINLGISLA